jgi:hypothetical protein
MAEDGGSEDFGGVLMIWSKNDTLTLKRLLKHGNLLEIAKIIYLKVHANGQKINRNERIYLPNAGSLGGNPGG